MSLDKTFRFDESVCGRCGRTAPAGCICVGTKAFEPGRRVHTGAAGAGSVRMGLAGSHPTTLDYYYDKEDVSQQPGIIPNTEIGTVVYGNDGWTRISYEDGRALSLPNSEISYADDPEPYVDIRSLPPIDSEVHSTEAAEDYEEGKRNFAEQVRASEKKCFKALSDLIGYSVKASDHNIGDRVVRIRGTEPSSYVPEGGYPEVAPGSEDERLREMTGRDSPLLGDNDATVIARRADEEGRVSVQRQYDTESPEYALSSDYHPASRFTNVRNVVGSPYGIGHEEGRRLEGTPEQFVDPLPGEEQKCFKALSDLIGYNVKSELWRYYRPESGNLRIDKYDDTSRNPNRPTGFEDRDEGNIVEEANPTGTSFRDDTPQRLAEIAAEDDVEPEEFKYEKMLSYLNTGSGGALVPPPEFSLKAKKKKKTVQGEGKSQQNLESGDPVLWVHSNDRVDADGQKTRTPSSDMYYLEETGDTTARISGGRHVAKRDLFYDTSRKSQQNLEYGDPVILANRGVDADTQKETAQSSYVYGQADPENDSHIVYVAGSRFPYSSGGNVVLYDTSRANRRKSITPPRVKMGVMRATAPNRIDLVVEIVAKIFNEQAVQQFLQEMAGGIPPQQGKMFRKNYLLKITPPDKAALATENASRAVRGLGPMVHATEHLTYTDEYPDIYNPNAPARKDVQSDYLYPPDGRIVQYNTGMTHTTRREDKSFGTKIILKRLRVPFAKNLRGHLVKAGFTGTMQDAMGRRMCFSAGKRVHCARDERGTHDDKVRQEEAPVPGNLSSGEGTANPAMQGIDVLKEIKFRIQGIVAQCSLPPNAVRDVVLFLLEVPDEFLMAFNAELDMRGEEIRVILFEAVSALAPQPMNQVDSGRPVPPTLKMLKKAYEDLTDAQRAALRNYLTANPVAKDATDTVNVQRNLRGQPPGEYPIRIATADEWDKIHNVNSYPAGHPDSDKPSPSEGQKSIDPELLRNLPPRNLRNLGLDVFQQSWEDEKDPTKVTEKAEEDVTDVGAEMRRRRGESESSGNEQKSFPSPDLVLYEMQKNPNPTELEQMQMELLMRILNDRNFA